MKAILSNYHQSPRKVRLVADLVRGKSVGRAKSELSLLSKRASEPVLKLINSAVANAGHNQTIKVDDLFIKEIRVDKALTMKRWRPSSRGQAKPIRRRASHLEVVLGLKTLAPEVPVVAKSKQAKPVVAEKKISVTKAKATKK